MVTSLRLLLPGLLLLACSSREPAISVAIDDRPRPDTSDDAWMDFDAGPPSDAPFTRDVGGRFDRAGDVPTFDLCERAAGESQVPLESSARGLHPF